MVTEPIHPLRKWREEQGLTLDAAAAGVGSFRGTWCDWETGRRIPDRNYMPKVYLFTAGAITADSFHFPFGYPELHQPELQLEAEPAPLLEQMQEAA